MTTKEKIEAMNAGCKQSLSFTYFTTPGWSVSSYQDGTVFNNSTNERLKQTKEGELSDHDFDAFIDKCYKYYLAHNN